jgi:hypothetical protein
MLTTIRQPGGRLGYAATDLLLHGGAVHHRRLCRTSSSPQSVATARLRRSPQKEEQEWNLLPSRAAARQARQKAA